MNKSMWKYSWLLFLIFIGLLTTPCSAASVKKTKTNDAFGKAISKMVRQNPPKSSSGVAASDKYRTARLIVKVKKNTYDFSKYKPAAVIAGPEKTYLLQFSTIDAAKKAAKKLSRLSSVVYVEPDLLSATGSAALTASQNDDPAAEIPSSGHTASDSWGVIRVEASTFASYIKEKTNKSIKVAVVDTGVSPHPILENRLVKGYDFVDTDSDPKDEDYEGHGTHVAGIIAACTPNLKVKIMPIRVFNKKGITNSTLIGSAIRYAVDHGASVINLSLSHPHSNFLEDAVRYAIKKNVVVVCAAGNNEMDTAYTCPADMKETIVVGSTNNMDQRSFFSNYGETVDVTAPGENIWSASKKGTGYTLLSGTSQAAPHVAAEAAMYCLLYPTKTTARIEELIRNNTLDLGIKGWDIFYGAGRIKMEKPVDEESEGKSPQKILPEKVFLFAFDMQASVDTKVYLSALITPLNATEKTLTWTSSNEKVAKVQDGVVECIKPGITRITVKTVNGKKKSFLLHVYQVKQKKLPKGTLIVPHSSMSISEDHAKKVSVPLKTGVNKVQVYEGTMCYTAPKTGTYIFTYSNVKPVGKTNDSADKIISGHSNLYYFNSIGVPKLLEVKTKGGTTKGIMICSEYSQKLDEEELHFNPAKADVNDDLATRKAQVSLKKGQTVYIYTFLTSIVPASLQIKIAKK